MSNYDWTENQIQAAIGRGNKRSQGDWLGVGIFNVKNKKDSQGKKADAQDYRNLMAILVDRGLACDNREAVTSGSYKISFDTEAREKLEKKPEVPRFFSAGLLSSPALQKLPSDQDVFYYLSSSLVSSVYQILKPSDQNVFYDHSGTHVEVTLLKARIRWELILDCLRVLDNTGKIALNHPCAEYLDKNDKKILLDAAEELSCMYKAFEIGWVEISHYYPTCLDHNRMFELALLECSLADFVDSVDPPKIRLYAVRNLIQSISPIISFVLSWVEKKLGILPENLREILNDSQLFEIPLDKIYTQSRKFSSRSTQQKEYVEKSMFIIRILLNSSNPKVRKAAWNWIKAIGKRAASALGLLRREIGNRTKANEMDK
jgi:hypothetical protein